VFQVDQIEPSVRWYRRVAETDFCVEWKFIRARPL
jgi:hypothetical protein